MIIAAIIIGIILLIILILIFFIDIKLGIMVTLLLFLEGALIYCINSDSQPTAMDVYQGKTTLEITYRDSIPVDSVVVFKK